MRSFLSAYLRGIAVDHADVLIRFWTLDHELLAIGPDDLEGMDVQLCVDEIKEFLDIAQQFLTDALTGAVNAELHTGCAEEDGGCKQADGDGFADCILC